MTESFTYPGAELVGLGFKKQMTKSIGSVHKYDVTKPLGAPWPPNTNLINFCDETNANFGGSVNHVSPDRAIVSVYVD